MSLLKSKLMLICIICGAFMAMAIMVLSQSAYAGAECASLGGACDDGGWDPMAKLDEIGKPTNSQVQAPTKWPEKSRTMRWNMNASSSEDEENKDSESPEAVAVQTTQNVDHAIPAKESKLIYTAVLGDNARQVAFNLVSHLRSRGYPVEMDFMRRSLKAQMRDAGKKQAKWVIIIGTDEIQNDKIVLKNMASGEQKELQLSLAADQIESIVR